MRGRSGRVACFCPSASSQRDLLSNEIYITENGCGAADDPGADGIVYDSDRIMFLRSFTQLQRATSVGIPAEPDGQVRVVGRLPATGLT